jgi:hypothetical protein
MNQVIIAYHAVCDGRSETVAGTGRLQAVRPGSMRDFQAFARQTGNELVEQQTQVSDEFIHVLKPPLTRTLLQFAAKQKGHATRVAFLMAAMRFGHMFDAVCRYSRNPGAQLRMSRVQVRRWLGGSLPCCRSHNA